MTYSNQQNFNDNDYGQIVKASEAGVVQPEAAPVQPITVMASHDKTTMEVVFARADQKPRSIKQFLNKAIDIAICDDDVAESCIYRRPVGRDQRTGQQTFAEGMSIRMAEIVAATYGNIHVEVDLVEDSPTKVIVKARAIDLENNNFQTAQVVESTVTKSGRPYDERMRVVIIKAAMAKARRDAIFMVVPRAVAKPIEKAVRNILYGNAESMNKRRERVKGWIDKLGIDPERVYQALGVHGIVEMTPETLEVLTGLKSAIQGGDVTIDEAFPPIKVDKFAAAAAEAAKAEEQPKEQAKRQKAAEQPKEPSNDLKLEAM